MKVSDLNRSPSDPDYLTMCQLIDPIHLRAGQRVIVNGEQYIMRGRPTITVSESQPATPQPPEQPL
jgi:hypothetical protein